jgi:hypothetical protein
VVVNIKKPKYNFTVTTLTKVLVTLWTKDDLVFIPERYRLQYTFILRVYCWTGARLSAFFTGGFCYGVSSRHGRSPVARLTSQDVTLVLQRAPDRPWRLIYRIDQRWVKNNRDPENIWYEVTLLYPQCLRIASVWTC